MKREDFKEILPVHIEKLKDFINKKGECTTDDCEKCPFDHWNATNGLGCSWNEYRGQDKKVLLRNAKEFIELFKNDFRPKEAPKHIFNCNEETEAPETTDNVNQPNHYKLDGLDVEVLDIIKSVLTKEQFEGALHFNVIKYILRTNKKNGVEDLEKAHKYLGWLIDSKSGLKLNK